MFFAFHSGHVPASVVGASIDEVLQKLHRFAGGSVEAQQYFVVNMDGKIVHGHGMMRHWEVRRLPDLEHPVVMTEGGVFEATEGGRKGRLAYRSDNTGHYMIAKVAGKEERFELWDYATRGASTVNSQNEVHAIRWILENAGPQERVH